jgi:hypothetical protein
METIEKLDIKNFEPETEKAENALNIIKSNDLVDKFNMYAKKILGYPDNFDILITNNIVNKIMESNADDFLKIHQIIA